MTPYIRAGILEHFRATVEALGGDTDALLCEADVAPEVMTIPGIYLPYANYMALLDCAARETATPHFGLAMARSASTETLGTIGIIMTQARTVGAAWEALMHFYRIHDTYGTVGLRLTGEHAAMTYSIPANHLPGARPVHDVAAGVATNIMKQFCGATYRPVALSLPFPEPADLSCYAVLGADRLYFDGESMEMYFDRALLDRELPGGSDEMRSVLDHYLATREGTSVTPTSRRVEDLIRRLLPTGDCTLQRVAQTLATTARTLQARLASEHSSFRDLLEKVRREIATYHLSRGDIQLTQLALILGYSELSAFSRSFRQWYGVSPRKWGAEHRWSH